MAGQGHLRLVQLHHSESEFVPQPKGCEVPNIQGAPSGKAPAEEDPLEVNVRAAAARDSRDGAARGLRQSRRPAGSEDRSQMLPETMRPILSSNGVCRDGNRLSTESHRLHASDPGELAHDAKIQREAFDSAAASHDLASTCRPAATPPAIVYHQ